MTVTMHRGRVLDRGETSGSVVGQGNGALSHYTVSRNEPRMYYLAPWQNEVLTLFL